MTTRQSDTTFEILSFTPRDCVDAMRNNAPEWDDELASQMFGCMKRLMHLDHCAANLPTTEGASINFHYLPVGTSAGIVYWRTGVERAETVRPLAATALLPRLDRAEEREAMDLVRSQYVLDGIAAGCFDRALDGTAPMAANFFVDAYGASFPFLNCMQHVAAKAFFDLLGM